MPTNNDSITCPTCAKVFAAKPELAGKRAKCKCGQILQFPPALSTSAPAPSPRIPSTPLAASRTTPSATHSPPGPNRPYPGLATLMLIGTLTCLAGLGVWMWGSNHTFSVVPPTFENQPLIGPGSVRYEMVSYQFLIAFMVIGSLAAMGLGLATVIAAIIARNASIRPYPASLRPNPFIRLILPALLILIALVFLLLPQILRIGKEHAWANMPANSAQIYRQDAIASAEAQRPADLDTVEYLANKLDGEARSSSNQASVDFETLRQMAQENFRSERASRPEYEPIRTKIREVLDTHAPKWIASSNINEGRIYSILAAVDQQKADDFRANAQKALQQNPRTQLFIKMQTALGDNNTAQVSALLDQGYNPRIQDTPMGKYDLARQAIDADKVSILELLLKKGMDPNVPLEGGKSTLLQYVILVSRENDTRLKMANALLDAHADPDKTPDGGQTPLMLAIRNADLPLVQSLLDAHANVNAKDDAGQTALDRVQYELQIGTPQAKEKQAALLSHGAKSAHDK